MRTSNFISAKESTAEVGIWFKTVDVMFGLFKRNSFCLRFVDSPYQPRIHDKKMKTTEVKNLYYFGHFETSDF